MIETVKRPYEFLVRWRDGVISGAHVGFEVTTTENGQVLSTTPLPVVAVGDGGFPLADILGQIQIDALKDREAAKAAQAVADANAATAQAEAKAKADECTVHEQTIADLRAQLEAAKAAQAEPALA